MTRDEGNAADGCFATASLLFRHFKRQIERCALPFDEEEDCVPILIARNFFIVLVEVFHRDLINFQNEITRSNPRVGSR